MKQQFLGKRKVEDHRENEIILMEESLKKNTNNKTRMGAERGYFTLGGLNS